MKKILSIFLVLGFTQFINAQCGGSSVSSLIPNPSFESQSCCPSNHSQMNCANSWIQASSATTDYLHTCNYSNTPSVQPPPTPLPNGNGYVGIYDGRNNTSTWKEYLGVCLASPLVAGTQYTLQMSMAAAIATGSYSGASNLSRTFVIYGATNCSNLPFSGSACPTTSAGWSVVHSQTVTLSHTSWNTVSFTFTPSFNITGFIFGGNCSSTTGGMTNSGGGSTNYYFIDNLILNQSTFFQPPTVNLTSSVATTTCANPTANLNAGVSGGTAPYSYSWNNGLSNSGSHTVNPGSATNYTVTVTDANGCTGSDNLTVNVNENPPTANAGPNRTTTCNTPTASLAGSATGGTPGYSYSWNNGGGTSQNPTVNPGSSTTYTLTVTDANGCTDTDQTVVTVNETPPNANAGPNVTTTCTNPTAALSGSATGGSSPYSYSWNNGGGTSQNPTVNPNTNTTYTLTVTGANGCTDTDQAVVTVNETPPNANAGSNATVTCASPSATLSGSATGGSAPYSYSWNNGGGTSQNPTVSPTSNTTYTLTVTGSNGCTDTDQAIVTVSQALPTANAGPNVTTTCNSPTASLSGSASGGTPGYSYSWNNGGGNSQNPTVNPSSNTTYTLTVTDANGCSNTDQAVVTVNETPPNANAGPNVTTTCTNPTAALSGSATGGSSPYSYAWNNGAGSSASATVNPTGNTNYTLTVTGSNGCTDTDVVTVTVDKAPPTANAGSDATVNCATPSATLNGSATGGTPGYSYSWNNGGGTSQNPTVSPTSNTTYTLTVTGSNGCTDTDQAVVSVNQALPTANAGSDATTTCTTPTASLSGSASGGTSPYSYSWNNGAGSSASATVDPASTTTYTLTVTDANGCSNTDQAIITVDETAPNANAGADITTDCVTPTAALNGSATGGSSPYAYSWSNGAGSSASATVDPATNTTYTLTVTGANGCTDTDAVLVTVDEALPTANAGSDQVAQCNPSTVTLDGTASSGAGISYAWTGPNIVSGANSSSAVADQAGTYTLTVTGSNGCVDTDDVVVTNNTNYPVANAGLDTILDCNTSNVTLDGSNSGASANITYAWTTPDGNIVSGGTSTTPNVDDDGTYTLSVTDNSNGCVATDQAVVTYDTVTPVAALSGSSFILDCINTSATFDASASSGVGNAYSWTTADGNIVSGANTANPVVDSDGTYTLLITSANGCSNLLSTDIAVTFDTVTPVAVILFPDTLHCNQTSISLDASGSTNTVTYSWSTLDGNISTGANSANPTVDTSGTYYINLTAANGCTTLDSISVYEVSLPSAHALADVYEGEIDLDVLFSDTSSGVGLTYFWTLGNGDSSIIQNPTATYTEEGVYDVVLTVTDQYGCTDLDSIQVNAFEVLDVVIPNIFTPNLDGDNDVFKISGGGLEAINGQIMNRWGQVIYQWDALFGGWDGRTLAGQEASEGTYFYFIEITFNDGRTEKYQGPLALKR